MADHWKSTPKYWCKHCSVYVKDTPFERKQHEATPKHQGNLKRTLTGIQKDHARNEREKDKAKAEVERLNRIAGSGSGSSSVAPKPVATPTFTKSTKPANITAADQKRQWAQLAEMGIAIPDSARAEMAMAGNWQTVSRKVEHLPENEQDDKLNVGIRKRKFEGDDEREEAGDVVVRRGWGSTTKSYPASEPISEDLDSLLSKPLFTKKKSKQNDTQRRSSTDADPLATSAIQVKPDPDHDPSDTTAVITESTNIHQDQRSSSKVKSETTDSESKPIPPESAPNLALPVFKKRATKQSPASVAPEPSESG